MLIFGIARSGGSLPRRDGVQCPHDLSRRRASRLARSVRGRRRTDGDFGRIDAVGCLDDVPDRAGNVSRLQRDGAVAVHEGGRFVMSDRVGQTAFHHAGIDAGYADVRRLLAQPVRDRAHCELRSAVDGPRRHRLQGTDRADIDNLARLLALHYR